MDTTRQAVACFCGYCGASATRETETWWICEGCHEAEQLIDKHKAPETDEERHHYMGYYLTSLWSHKDKNGVVRCSDCDYEVLILGSVCSACGYDGREA